MSFVSKALAGPIAVLCLLTLAGCATQQPQDNQASINNDSFHQFIESAAPHATASLPASPWGANAQVTAGAAYFAASGKTCRSLQVTQAIGSQEEHIACKGQNGQWQLSRAITQQP